MDLALNNLQRLICHKIQPTNQSDSVTTPIQSNRRFYIAVKVLHISWTNLFKI